MSKKNTDSTEIAEKLLEKDTAKNNPIVSTFVKPISRCTLRPFYGYQNGILINYDHKISYPPNKTDQLHGATIADLVAQGQGKVEETDLANFDYPVKIVDGKPVATPDRGEKAYGPRSLEWADPAERYENELAVHNEIVTGIRREAAEKAEVLARQRAIENADKQNSKLSSEKTQAESK